MFIVYPLGCRPQCVERPAVRNELLTVVDKKSKEILFETGAILNDIQKQNNLFLSTFSKIPVDI